ncbi:hypothetical protein [Streptomyces djakartensis]|uniref:hypothetical protein n=1 Tax=Streptomyces djakartensis TaxID=68193 RepID=UPI0034DE1F13
MPDVIFKSIKCHETTGGIGADDVRIYFKGELLFNMEMKGGRHRNIGSGSAKRRFDTAETIWVKEVGSGSDEIIGTATVQPGGPLGELTRTCTATVRTTSSTTPSAGPERRIEHAGGDGTRR